MFFFMISLLHIINNRWNKSKIFILNKNWNIINNSINYFRYSRGFNFYKFKSNFHVPKKLKQSVEVTLPIIFKSILQFTLSVVSIIPHTVFNTKLGYGSIKTPGELVYSRECDYIFLKKIINFSPISLNLSNFFWKVQTNDLLNYSYRKVVFLKKIKLFNSYIFKLSDLIYLSFFSKFFTNLYKRSYVFRVDNFIKQVNWSFYKKNNLNNFSLKNSFNLYFIGLRFFWYGIRYWFVGIFMFLLSFFFFINLKGLLFNKTVFGYFIVGMFFYWLISGFVFFIKKYQYSKFTSVIQRFWKRTFIIFWMIEGSLFVCFFYLVLNAPEEPLYMYDQIKIYKTHLFSWRWFLIKLIPSIMLIVLGFYLQMLIRWGVFLRQSPLTLLITVLIVYIFWVEFYQFLHVVSYYGNFFWVYDYDEFLWSLELDDRRNRIVNNSVAISLIAKFWHIVFMFIFWVFFILRANEVGRIRYALVAANNQNFVLLYIISWVYMYPWFKYIFRKQLDVSYYWFNLHFRKTGLRVFFIDIKLHFYGFLGKLGNLFYITQTFNYNPLFYWHELGSKSSLSSLNKSSISNKFITILNHAY